MEKKALEMNRKRMQGEMSQKIWLKRAMAEKTLEMDRKRNQGGISQI